MGALLSLLLDLMSQPIWLQAISAPVVGMSVALDSPHL